MIKDPEGAYSQLVRLQEGANHSENKVDMNHDIDMSVSMSTSHRLSITKSISRGSSSSRRSFQLTYFPGPVSIHETELESEEIHGKRPEDGEKHRNVSIRRLAYLNKPEMPVLLLGSIAAAIHGVIFPIFGLLMSSAINMFYEPLSMLRKDSESWALKFVGIGFLALVSIPVQNYLFGVAGGKLIERIRALSFEKVVHQEISWFDDPANSRCVWLGETIIYSCLNSSLFLSLTHKLCCYFQRRSWGKVINRCFNSAESCGRYLGPRCTKHSHSHSRDYHSIHS